MKNKLIKLLIYCSIFTSQLNAKTKDKVIENKNFLETITQKYRTGELNDSGLWNALVNYSSNINQLTIEEKTRLLQIQSTLLIKDNYPVLAAIYASQAIRNFKNPYDEKIEKSWEVLHKAADRAPIHNILESLSSETTQIDKVIPGFKSEWNYFVANSHDRAGRYKEAIEFYKKVKVTDKYYFPASYKIALAFVSLNEHKEAEESLKKILFETSQKLTDLTEDQKIEMTNLAYMALGRIYYEQKKFEQSFRSYREVKKDSVQYYDALFEQAWAFFMAGYPNHTLGAIHSLQSPFFDNRYNPEASMLKSIAYFWMCQYEESKLALVEFKKNYEDAIKGLLSIIERKTLKAESAYQLFEDFALGVSSESLGIPREIINTAVTQDSMMQVRDQYATILEEKRRLSIRGVLGSKKGFDVLNTYLENWQLHLKKEIGERFLIELENLKSSFDSLNEQSEFLDLELIMSEKDQLLGKELHAKDKMTSVSSSKVYGWGKQTNQFWSGDKKEEYWWDEIGFYIYQVKPRCNIK